MTATASSAPRKSSGRCLCGEIGFAVGFPSRWVAHCHCSMCRRAHGAAFVTWISIDSDKLQIQDPQQRLRWFDSSANAQRGFCNHCGSTLFFRSSRWPGEVHVTLANIDGGVDRAPQVHAFWDTHVGWVQLGDALPRRTAAEIG